MRPIRFLIASAAIAAAGLAPPASVHAQEPASGAVETRSVEAPVPRIGFEADVAFPPLHAADSAMEPGGDDDAPVRVPVRVRVSWAAVEPRAGEWSWQPVQARFQELWAAGYEPVAVLLADQPAYLGEARWPSPLVSGSLEGWTRFLRRSVEALGPWTATFQVGEGVGAEGATTLVEAARSYAFALKHSALVLRAEGRRRGLPVTVVQAEVRGQDLSLQQALWEEAVSAYADVVPVRVPAGTGGAAQVLEAFTQASLDHPPAPRLWAVVSPGGDLWDDGVAAAVEALASGAQQAFVMVEPDAGEDPGVLEGWVRRFDAAMAAGYAPAPSARAAVLDAAGRPLEGAFVSGRFFAEADFSTLLVVHLAPAGPAADDWVWVAVDALRIREAWAWDPAEGRRRLLPTGASPDGSGQAIRLPASRRPWIVVFRKVVAALPGLEAQEEELDVRRERPLTAAEIIARHQQVQKLQDDRLERWMARGRVEFHFRFAQAGGSVDVAIESNYFWERGGYLEWEQTDYYINGNRVRWKKIPELPLIQPEKVVTLPLDLTLDRTYVYRLAGEDRVGGRDTYVLVFEPADPDAPLSLYRGRVWIDKESFVRLRASLVQTQLEPPVLSNEETDDFVPIEGPDGETYWMIGSVYGQQVWTAGGRNFVVQRELTFTQYQINPDPEVFRSRRAEAYASEHQMLRDTERGFRYLERRDDGTRVVKESVDPSQLFAAGGLYKDSSLDSVVPLAGVNYFNYDLWNRGIQFNAFFAGVFAFVNATKPDLFGGHADGAVETALFGLKRNDKVFAGDQERLPERVDVRSQSVSGRLGFPLGQFFKLTLVGNVSFVDYAEDSEARDALAALRQDPVQPRNLRFVLPEDHRQLTAAVQLEFNRRGYSVNGEWARSSRSDWKPWGLFDDDQGSFVGEPFDPAQERFTRWRISAAKEWFLPRFQKLRAEATYLDGEDLDRFSRYQFSTFGDTGLSGFSGSGVRFDRGVVARAGYAFNVFDVIRLSANVERAQVRRTGAPGDQAFTGVGLSGNFVGPWKTVYSISFGRALQSDIADLEGQNEFLVVVLKLF